MSRLLRLLCLTLAVAFMASLSLHGPADALDQLEHVADRAAAAHGLEVSGHGHSDCGEEGEETAPGHHHHSADSHSFAVADRTGADLGVARTARAVDWPQDRLPAGLGAAGPDQPPKRTLTLA